MNDKTLKSPVSDEVDCDPSPYKADSIHVIVQYGGTVVLQGNVKAWHEYEIAKTAARVADGITDVVDQLTIR